MGASPVLGFVVVRATFALPADFGCGVFLLMSVVVFMCDIFDARPASSRTAPHVALQGSRPATHAFFRPASDTRSTLHSNQNATTPAPSAGYRV